MYCLFLEAMFKTQETWKCYEWWLSLGSRRMDDFFSLQTVLFFPNFPQGLMYCFYNNKKKVDNTFQWFLSSPAGYWIFSSIPESPTELEASWEQDCCYLYNTQYSPSSTAGAWHKTAQWVFVGWRMNIQVIFRNRLCPPMVGGPR